jgi:trimeric autotransporter adhesin
MKRPLLHSLSFITTSLSLLIVLLSPRAGAVVYYWDPNGLGGPTSGTWDTTTPQWSTNSALTATPVVWDPTAAAGFPAGTAGTGALTITVNSPINFAGMFNGLTSTIGVTNLVLNGSGSLNLNPGLQAFWTGSNAYNTIIRVPITGTGGLQNQSGGSLYLSGANTYSGGTSMGTSAGLNFNNGNAFGTGPITNAVTTTVLATPATDSSGATFAATPVTIANNVATFGGSGSLIYVGIPAAPATFIGSWTLAGAAGTTSTLQNQPSGTTLTLSGVVSGVANFAKAGAGTLVLSGANTFSGKASVNNGILSVNSLNKVVGGTPSSSLGAPTTVANGTINLGATTTSGTLLYIGPGETTDRIINVAGTTGGGTIQNDGSGPLVFTTDLLATNTGSKTFTLQGTNIGNNTFAGKIVNGFGAVAVTKAGAGTWALSGANTYSGGTTLSSGGGRLNLANASALGTGTFTIGGNSYFDNTAGSDLTVANSLSLTGGSPTYVGTANNMTINGAVNVNNNRTITVSARTLTLGSAITQDATPRNFTKAGAGTLVLAGGAAYTGNTTISGGTLVIAGTGQMGAGNYAGAITDNATFNYSSSAAQTLSGIISGTGALVQNGPGTLTLSALNTYSGPTTVAAGTLDISATGSITASPVTVASLATLQLDSNTALGPTVNLLLNSGSLAINLNYIGTDQIQSLSFDGGATIAPAGIYGGIGSGATFQDPRFTGPGLLVVLSPSTANVSPSPNPATYGDTVTLTASVIGVGPTPAGTVTFKEGATILGTQILDATSSAMLSTNGFAAGSHSITVTYSGDVIYAPSTSPIFVLMVNKAALSITANDQTKVYGQTVIFGSSSTAFSSTGLQNGEAIGTVILACAGGVATAPIVGSPYPITPSAATGGTFNANNYAITYNTGNLAVTPATLNVTATGLLVYGFDPTNAIYFPQYAPLQGTDTFAVITGSANFSTDATSTNYVGSNYVAHVIDTGTLSSPNYTFVPGRDGLLTITNRPLAVTNVLANNRLYDGTATAALDFSGAGLDSLVNGDDAFVFLVASGAFGAFANKNVGTNKAVTVIGLSIFGDLGTNYFLIQPTATTANIRRLPVTVTAVPDTKVFDGTTTSTGVSVPIPPLASGDTGIFSQTFDTKNAGTGKTITPAGSVNDGNGGVNYSLTFATITTGEITGKPITVTAVTDAKVYDGTAASVGAPNVSPALIGGDTPGFSQAFNNKNVGTGKTLIPAGSVNDGNSGANYSVTFVNDTTGVISAKPITVTAVATTKIYDGTTSSAGDPMISPFPAVGDTSNFSQTYDTKNVGAGKTLTPSGSVNDGNSGANYSVTFVNDTNGVISAKPITVTAVATTKVYDGTISSAGDPTIVPSLAIGDTANFSQTYDTKNAGTGKTLTPAGSVNDGNGGTNYALIFATVATGEIDPKSITVTALTDTKVYDGTSASTGVPSVSPALVSSDAPDFSQVFNNKNVGTSKTLIPAGSVSDGNGGANYSVTFVNDTNGIISAKPISVTAVSTTKVYDGTTSSPGNPTIAPVLIVGDTANFSQSYDTKNVGIGKILTPSGSVNDGNAGTNYSVTFFNNSNGVITAVTSATTLVSSVNPSTLGSNVTFTMTVNGVPPAADLPTGDVIFSANGMPFATNTLTSGSASANTDTLPVGTNTVTAVYHGDGNFLSSTGALNQIVTNSIIYSTTNIILSITNNNDGKFTLNLLGTPGAEYYLVSSPDVSLPLNTWNALTGSTNIAPTPDGLWSVVVSNTAPAFYRSAAIHPAP